MEIKGNVLAGLGKLCLKDAPGGAQGYVHVDGGVDEDLTYIEASDGIVAARLITEKTTNLACLVSRDVTGRLKASDEVHVDSIHRGGQQMERLTAPFEVDLPSAKGGEGAVVERAYPDMDDLFDGLGGKGAIVLLNVAALRRLVTAFDDVGIARVELRISTKPLAPVRLNGKCEHGEMRGLIVPIKNDE